MSTRDFFSSLPVQRISVSQLLAQEERFAAVPSDWHVIVTDIKNSTGAFGRGLHQEVNLIATGSIICTLNLAQKAGIQIPFFFGGDGATLIVPSELIQTTLDALHVHRVNSMNRFELELRVGSVAVSALNAPNDPLRISRIYLTPRYAIPVILGSGLATAEKMIKAGSSSESRIDSTEIELDLSGMECRWDKIKPAKVQHEVVCLLATAQDDTLQAPVFKEVIDIIDSIYGPFSSRNPVSIPRLQLDSSFSKIMTEMRARSPKFDMPYVIKHWLSTLIGKWIYLKREKGQEYIQSLIELTDTLVLDGRINTVIAGTNMQRNQLVNELNRLEQEEKIKYGLFVSQESVMSCYVQDRKDNHIHFVDGSDGGYTMAARVLKQKLRS